MSNYEAPKSLAITNAVIVLPDRVIERGAVGIVNGRIAEVADDGGMRDAYEEWVDARGAYLLPGVIDLHNDSLETEVNPRPDTNLPLEFALASAERRLLFSGVTTEFHAIAFMDNARAKRTAAAAAVRSNFMADYVAGGNQIVDNNVLHRLDVWSPDTLDSLFASLERQRVRYVSINDHTPGQGQYRDMSSFKERMIAWQEQRGRGALDLDETEQRMQERNADQVTVPMVYARIRAEQERLGFVIASHDDDSPEKVDTLFELGARISEFPVDVDTARQARKRGMAIVVGAPNIVRGGSSSGNQDAQELFALGLADVICADYHAPSLLPAAFKLVDDGTCDLRNAIRSVSYNAARALGRHDLGAILPGFVADLLLVTREGHGLPQVERVWRGGRAVLTMRPAATAEVVA